MLWLWIILGVLLGFLIFSLIASASLFRGLLVKPHFSENDAPLSRRDKELFFSENTKAVEWFNTLLREEVYITSYGLKLHGVFINQKSDKTVILVHGYAAKLKYRIQDAPFYYKEGLNILLIDLRAHGDSEGKYITVGKYESLDLLEWIKWLNKKTKNSKIILDGVSMGAATVLCATALDLPKNVIFAVADCSYTSMRDLVHSMFSRYMLMPGWLMIGLGEGYARKWGKFSLYRGGPLECVQKAKIPILFIHGENDKLIPPSMTDRLYEKCPTQKFKLKIPKAGHAMSFCYDRQRCNRQILQLINQTMQQSVSIARVAQPKTVSETVRKPEIKNFSQDIKVVPLKKERNFQTKIYKKILKREKRDLKKINKDIKKI